MIANTPKPPYYAVVFTSVKSTNSLEEYKEMASLMEDLVQKQPGYLGHESASNELGITVSYWESLEHIKQWKQNADHLFAQQKGKEMWYLQYKTRICLVEKDYSFESFR